MNYVANIKNKIKMDKKWIGSDDGEYSYYERGDVICGRCKEPMIAGFCGLNHNLPHKVMCIICGMTLMVKGFGKYRDVKKSEVKSNEGFQGTVSNAGMIPKPDKRLVAHIKSLDNPSVVEILEEINQGKDITENELMDNNLK